MIHLKALGVGLLAVAAVTATGAGILWAEWGHTYGRMWALLAALVLEAYVIGSSLVRR